MSAETTANSIVLKFLGRIQTAGRENIPEGSVRWLRDAVRDAIAGAADKEREACARIADGIPDRGKKNPPTEQVLGGDCSQKCDGVSLEEPGQ
jgi:hypothetical protein